jgi:membrane protein YdbS with pleckstrin-like domain
MRAPKLQEPNQVRLERPAYQEFSGDTPWEMRGVPSSEDEAEAVEKQPEGEDKPGAEYDDDSGLEIRYRGHESWISYWKWVLAALLFLGLGAGGMALFANWWFVAGGVLAASITLCIASILRTHRDYTITVERIEHEWGFFGRSSKEVRIQDVRSLDVEVTGFLGLLGIGTLNVSSAGSEEVEVQFKHVYRPHRLKELIRQLQPKAPVS